MHFKLSLFKTELIIFPTVLFLPFTPVSANGTITNLVAQNNTLGISWFLLPFYSFNKYVLNAFFNPSTVSVAEIKQTQIPFFMEFTFSLGVILVHMVNNENTENLR